MLLTGAFRVLLVVIVAGIVTTWRLMRRETEMARLESDFVANVSHDLKTRCPSSGCSGRPSKWAA